MDEADAMLRAFLAERDEPCPGCGYSLRDLTGARCPECNQELRLRVGLAEPRLGSYLGAMSGLLAGWGASAVFLGVFLWFTMRQGAPPRREWLPVYGIPSLAFVLLGSLALALGRQRGRMAFRSWSGGARAAAIAGAWLASPVFIVWFFSVI